MHHHHLCASVHGSSQISRGWRVHVNTCLYVSGGARWVRIEKGGGVHAALHVT